MPSQEALAIFELGQQSLRLAGATKPCPQMGKWGHFDDPGKHWPDGKPYCFGGCNGTGRGYLFPAESGVRVACPGIVYSARGHRDHKHGCCHGLGWTPATDGWVWWRAAQQLYFETNTNGYFTFKVNATDDPEPAFFAKLIRTVRATTGAELMEVAVASN